MVSGKALLIIGEPVFVYLVDSLLGLMAKSDSQFNADTFNEQEQMLICEQKAIITISRNLRRRV